MVSPGLIGQVLPNLLMVNSNRISTSNCCAISQQLSFSLTVYSNGPEGVNVASGVGVRVTVGVMVTVGVGGTSVGVDVMVGVGVLVLNRVTCPLPGPTSQTTRKTIPTMTSNAAAPPRIKGSSFCFRRYFSMTSCGFSLSLIGFPVIFSIMINQLCPLKAYYLKKRKMTR